MDLRENVISQRRIALLGSGIDARKLHQIRLALGVLRVGHDAGSLSWSIGVEAYRPKHVGTHLVHLKYLLLQLGLMLQDGFRRVQRDSLSHAPFLYPQTLLVRTQVIDVDASILVVVDARRRYVIALDTLLRTLVALSDVLNLRSR